MKEALKLALEALEDNQHLVADNERHAYVMAYNRVIERCEEALAQPEQEPVAWMYESVCGNDFATRHCAPDYAKNIRPLYTTPPQRTWVGLTDEEKKNIFLKWYGKHWAYTEQVQAVMDSVEAKLKEKNT